MKKLIAILIYIMILAGLVIPTGVSEASVQGTAAIEFEDYEYLVQDDGTVQITKYKGRESEPEIPGEIEGKTVSSIGENAFSSHKSFTSIVIPDGVTEICDYAFYYCENLTSIEIPDSVTKIGNNAFEMCSSLTNIELPDSLTEIGDYAFYLCANITSVDIPESVISLGANPFKYCYKLTKITVNQYNEIFDVINGALYSIPERKLICYPVAFNAESFAIPQGIYAIGDSAFYYCTNLRSIEIPDSVTSIGDSAFYWCLNITSIEIPSSVTEIGDLAFYTCNSITSIDIPESVATIGVNPFASCDNLTAITVEPSNLLFDVIDGALYSIADKRLISYPKAFTAGSLSIPQGINAVGGFAFYECENLTSIEIPDSVTSIGESAFSGCRNISYIEIPDSVTSIDAFAFVLCDNLTITAPEGSYAIQYAKENGIEYVSIAAELSANSDNGDASAVDTAAEESFEQDNTAYSDNGSAAEIESYLHNNTVFSGNVSMGDIVTFGSYEQDNDSSNGKEAIEWIVLDIQDGKALLLSRYGLDAKAYNTELVHVTWENCTLRSWLNDEFINEAFSGEEQDCIDETEVTASASAFSNIDPGNDTLDKVFLPDVAIANIYFNSYDDRQCAPTAYAIAHGGSAYSYYGGNSDWWIRAPGTRSASAVFVSSRGEIGYGGGDVSIKSFVVRPALWVNLEP